MTSICALPLRDDDNDLLPILNRATDEDLKPLADYITDKGKGRITSRLDGLDVYKQHSDSPSRYPLEIASEIQTFGGNTVANLMRGGKGVYYREVVRDVAEHLDVNYNSEAHVADIESQILLKILEKSYEKMTDQEREDFLKSLGTFNNPIPAALPVALLQAAVRLGGIAAYRIAALVANSVAVSILGRGLALGANAAAMRGIGAFAGPVGWALTAIWTVYDLASPAYRVTVPCIVHVAFLRQKQSLPVTTKTCPEGHFNLPQAKFCSECGHPLG